MVFWVDGVKGSSFSGCICLYDIGWSGGVRREASAARRCREYIGVIVRCVGGRLNRRVSLRGLTRVSRFSPCRFRHVVGTFLRRPLKTFVMHAEVRATTQLLHCDSVSIDSVTCRVNCNSPSSLSGVFGRFCNVSPGRCEGGGSRIVVGPLRVGPTLSIAVRMHRRRPGRMVCIQLAKTCVTLTCYRT